MLARLATCALVLAACNPKDPGDSASEGESTGAPATTTSQVPTEPTSSTTTQASTEPTSSTTGDAEPSSSSTTGELPACSWFWPEFQLLTFCPAPVEMDVPITGMTPAGPLTLRFALFALQPCAHCPNAEDPAITLYAEHPGDKIGNPPFDHLEVYIFGGGVWSARAQIAGESLSLDTIEISLELKSVPSESETSPPLNEAAPPALTGILTIQGDGWDLAGSFTATLCTKVNWPIACE